MSQCSESHKEAVGLIPFLTSRTLTRQSSYMEHRENVRSGENDPSSERNEELQDWSSRTERDKVAIDRTAEIVIRRAAVVLGSHGGWNPPQLGCGSDAGTRGTVSTHRLGTSQLPHHPSQVCHQEEGHQAEHHPVLCSHQ